tara:strand:- start:1661 stop:2986 length:1326 start_codon:yes stop_codon:yes gene_type:complete
MTGNIKFIGDFTKPVEPPKPMIEDILVSVDKNDQYIFLNGGWFGNKKNDKHDFQLSKPVLYTDKAYKFIRLIKRDSKYKENPFYIRDSSDTLTHTNIELEGEGDFTDGIINRETFLLKFKDTFDINTHKLYYYDTDNSNNILEFKVKGGTHSLVDNTKNSLQINIQNKLINGDSNTETSTTVQQADIVKLQQIKDETLNILRKYITDMPQEYAIKLSLATFTSSDNTTILGYAQPGGDNRIVLNKAKLDETGFLNKKSTRLLVVTLLHEIFHIFGLIDIGSTGDTTTTENVSINGRDYLWKIYNGNNGVEQYRKFLKILKSKGNYKYSITTNNLSALSNQYIDKINYILLEDDFSAGTEHVHLEEGLDEDFSLERYEAPIDGVQVHHPSIMNEITTGFQNKHSYITRITLGMLEDLNFKVNYRNLEMEESQSNYFHEIVIV